VESKTLLVGFLSLFVPGTAVLADDPAIRSKDQTSKETRVDKFGDPLPPGAGARLGKIPLRHKTFIRHLAYSKDGKLLASASWSAVRVGNQQIAFKEVTALAFSPGGEMLAIAARDFSNGISLVHFWDLTTGRLGTRDFRENDCHIVSLAYSPDGKTLAGAVQQGGEGLVRLWNLASGEARTLCRFQHSSGAWNAAFAPDGKSLACPGDGDTVCLVELDTGKILQRFKGHESEVTAVVFAPGGKVLISGSKDQTIRFWDLTSKKESQCLEGHGGYVINLNLSADGTVLASRDSHETVRLWSTTTGKELVACRRAGNGGMALAPNGKLLALATAQKAVDFWEVPSGREYVPDPKHAPFLGHRDTIISLAFSEDGTRLASAALDETVRIWDPHAMKPLKKYEEQVKAVSYSPDGILILSDDKGRHWIAGKNPWVTRWLPGQEVSKKWPAVLINGKVGSRDGRMQALAEEDGSVRLLEAASSKQRRLFKGHVDKVSAAVFSANGKLLATGSADTTILIWNIYGTPTGPIDSKKLDTLWNQLASEDAAVAFSAVCALIHAPKQSIPFLKKQLQALGVLTEARLNMLIADLDNDRFPVRKKAMEEIKEALENGTLSPAVFEQAWKKRLTGKASLEFISRGLQLLKSLPSLDRSPRRLRLVRATEALEHVEAALKSK